MSKAAKIIIIVAVSLLVLGGAAAGFIVWKKVEGNKLVAEIKNVELLRGEGKTVDRKDVPLDEDLVLKVTYLSRYKDEGEASLEITVVDGNGEETLKDSFEPESSGDLQEYEYDFYILMSEGETFKATAFLEVSRGDNTAKDSDSLEFYVNEGKGEEARFDEAMESAAAKIDEAGNAVAETEAAGIDTADLSQSLDTVRREYDAATTEAEAKAVYAAAEAIVNECNKRKAAAADEAARQQDIAAARKVMFDYAYAEKGNCEDVWWVDFSMNNERTSATGKLEGMVTVHTDPDRAGQKTYFFLTAQKSGGRWVVTDYSYEHVL